MSMKIAQRSKAQLESSSLEHSAEQDKENRSPQAVAQLPSQTLRAQNSIRDYCNSPFCKEMLFNNYLLTGKEPKSQVNNFQTYLKEQRKQGLE